MKILIATGIYPPDIGGPAYYAQELKRTMEKLGNEVYVAHYQIEKKLPILVRHVVFLVRTLLLLRGVECIIALDTLSTGVPAVLAARITGKKVIVRVGGDFLWESYVERTGKKILFSEFYRSQRQLSFKEKIIFQLTKYLLQNASAIAFSTEWQRDIFADGYGLDKHKAFIVENFYGERNKGIAPSEKNFLWAGRRITLKNIDILEDAFKRAKKKKDDIKLELFMNIPHHELMEKIKRCYAIIVPSVSDISPNLVLEGIMYGKPFVLTRYTGLREKLSDVGLFVDPLDPTDISEKILLLSRDDIYQKYVKNISQFNFLHSYDDIAGELINIYKTI